TSGDGTSDHRYVGSLDRRKSTEDQTRDVLDTGRDDPTADLVDGKCGNSKLLDVRRQGEEGIDDRLGDPAREFKTADKAAEIDPLDRIGEVRERPGELVAECRNVASMAADEVVQLGDE